MRVKVLILALMAVLVALPVPASQLLAGTFSAPTHSTAPDAALATLIADPFLIDRLSFTPATKPSDLDG